MSQYNRARDDAATNVLMGQFVGDALGTTLEFRRAHECKNHREIVGGGPFNMLPGQVTDDGELAIACARALKTRGFDIDGRREAYEAWAATNPPDIGTTTAAAFRRREISNESQANGALMRISPLAVFASVLPEDRAARLAREDAALSHPACASANAAFVRAIHCGLNGGTPQQAFEKAKAELSALTATIPTADGANQGWVMIAIDIAFHHLLHTESFEEALVQTVALGGDTDTNGAITGALLGAFRDDIPQRWIDKVLECKTTRPYHPTETLDLFDPQRALFSDAIYPGGVRIGSIAKDDFAIVTAFNPHGQPALNNEERQRDLIARITHRHERGQNTAFDGSHAEDSVVIFGIRDADAIALGRRFDQAAIVIGKKGLPVQLVSV